MFTNPQNDRGKNKDPQTGRFTTTRPKRVQRTIDKLVERAADARTERERERRQADQRERSMAAYRAKRDRELEQALNAPVRFIADPRRMDDEHQRLLEAFTDAEAEFGVLFYFGEDDQPHVVPGITVADIEQAERKLYRALDELRTFEAIHALGAH